MPVKEKSTFHCRVRGKTRALERYVGAVTRCPRKGRQGGHAHHRPLRLPSASNSRVSSWRACRRILGAIRGATRVRRASVIQHPTNKHLNLPIFQQFDELPANSDRRRRRGAPVKPRARAKVLECRAAPRQPLATDISTTMLLYDEDAKVLWTRKRRKPNLKPVCVRWSVTLCGTLLRQDPMNVTGEPDTSNKGRGVGRMVFSQHATRWTEWMVLHGGANQTTDNAARTARWQKDARPQEGASHKWREFSEELGEQRVLQYR